MPAELARLSDNLKARVLDRVVGVWNEPDDSYLVAALDLSRVRSAHACWSCHLHASCTRTPLCRWELATKGTLTAGLCPLEQSPARRCLPDCSLKTSTPALRASMGGKHA
jgi:hypothetical protein